jgi:hypothetical protein
MSEKDIEVPEGMRLAVAHAVFDQCGKCDYHPQIRIALETACRWQNENPRRLTDAEIHEFYSGECEAGVSFEFLQRFAEWFQRRMFLQPQQEVDPLVMYIERHFEDAYGDKRGLRNRAEAAVFDYKEHMKRSVDSESEKLHKSIISQLDTLLASEIRLHGALSGEPINKEPFHPKPSTHVCYPYEPDSGA